MKLVIITGRSGAGKSTALHVLEDLGFFAIDNVPAELIPDITHKAIESNEPDYQRLAIIVDARNITHTLDQFPEIVRQLEQQNISLEVIYLDADDSVLLHRFSETRRKHPLSNNDVILTEAIAEERILLEPFLQLADLTIDTSQLTIHQLRDLISTRLASRKEGQLALLFQSFAFKKGIPSDADMVFDVRCLPNPYWNVALRTLTGKDEKVAEYLRQQLDVTEMLNDIRSFLDKWLPRFIDTNRSYITVAIGCTGGQHRSVFCCEQLAKYFTDELPNVLVRHREL
ncbi:MAG: RNase adapter RapZ [Pseudomonadales bacterium]|nr:RNase adapter RapZ [Pseudomonadales bacterium]